MLFRQRCVSLAFCCCATLLLVLVAARIGTWRHPWLLEVLDMFVLFACTPFLAVGLAAIVFRPRALGVLTGLALLFVAQQFGGRLVRLVGAADAAAGRARTSPTPLRALRTR